MSNSPIASVIEGLAGAGLAGEGSDDPGPNSTLACSMTPRFLTTKFGEHRYRSVSPNLVLSTWRKSAPRTETKPTGHLALCASNPVARVQLKHRAAVDGERSVAAWQDFDLDDAVRIEHQRAVKQLVGRYCSHD